MLLPVAYESGLSDLFENYGLKKVIYNEILGTSGDNKVQLIGECVSREGDSFER